MAHWGTNKISYTERLLRSCFSWDYIVQDNTTESLQALEAQRLQYAAQSLTGFGTSIWRLNSEKNTRMSTSAFLSTDYHDRLFRFNYHIAQRWTFDMESGKYCQYSVITLESEAMDPSGAH